MYSLVPSPGMRSTNRSSPVETLVVAVGESGEALDLDLIRCDPAGAVEPGQRGALLKVLPSLAMLSNDHSQR